MKPRWQASLCCGWLLLSWSLICSTAHADTHHFDQSTPPAVPAPLPNEESVQTESAHAETVQDKSLLQLSGKELNKHPHLMAQLIEQLIKQKQWELLPSVLADYEILPEADPYLILYAKGALHRHQKNYYLAIGAFQALLHLKPELTYIRLDLAMMQIEDKRYSDAIKTLNQLVNLSGTPTQVKRLAETYLSQLQKFYDTDFVFSSSFVRNDNVNQASAVRTIELWGMEFVKNPESLPKTAHGINYGIGIRKMLPLQGNHGLSLDLQNNGTYYWDQKGYSERILRFSPAYRYQTYDQWFKVGPVYEKNWLGNKEYGTRLGAQVEWGKQIRPRHYLIPYADYADKRYESSGLARYEGHSYRTGLTWVYQPRAGDMLSAGAHYQQDALNDQAESSNTVSLRFAGSHKTTGGLNMQVSLYVGRRDFEAMHPIFGFTRHDKELMGSIGVWHNKLSVMGITPKLVYRFSDIRSNIPALYSRQSRGWMLEMVDVVF